MCALAVHSFQRRPGYILVYVAQNAIFKDLIHPQPPIFGGFVTPVPKKIAQLDA